MPGTQAALPGAPRVRPSAAVLRVELGLLVAMHVLVLANAVLHPPAIAYDAEAHLAYAVRLSAGELPSRADTYEFFSPPLAYALPALGQAAGLSAQASAKAAQLLAVALSLGIALGLLRLCRLAAPAEPWLGAGALGLLATLPVYYRTLSQPFRGEVWLALLGLLLAQRLLLLVDRERLGARDAAVLGALAGGLLLARQWGVWLLVAASLFLLLGAVRRRPLRRPALLAVAALAAGALLLAGWFYARLFVTHGSAAAFNRKRPAFSLANQPASFYFGTGNGRSFDLPLRPAFPNQLLPILYADTWGDYWQYFLVWGRTPHRVLAGDKLEATLARAPSRVVTNRPEVGRYLGRVAGAALLPSLVLLAGLLRGAWALASWVGRGERMHAGRALCALMAVVTFAGYLLFLVAFPSRQEGDTIKATYLLQAFPFLALLGGDLLVALRRASRLASALLVAGLGAVALYTSGALVTRFPAAALPEGAATAGAVATAVPSAGPAGDP